MLKNVGLPSYLSQLLVKPLPVLVLSPKYTFLVAVALADIYFTTNVVFDFEGSLSKMVGDGAIWLPYLGSATSNL